MSEEYIEIRGARENNLKNVSTLDQLRGELGFEIIGYVLMPEHCHLMIWPCDLANPSHIMQKLSERTANFILRNLRRNPGLPWCRKMLKGFDLPPRSMRSASCLPC